MTTDDDRFQNVMHDAALLTAILLGVVGGLWLVEHYANAVFRLLDFIFGRLQ